MDGQAQIAAMMNGYREASPAQINGVDVLRTFDYQKQQCKDLRSGVSTPLSLPASNVLIFELADGSLIAARPSGTEPKIKCYIEIVDPEKTIALSLLEQLRPSLRELLS